MLNKSFLKQVYKHFKLYHYIFAVLDFHLSDLSVSFLAIASFFYLRDKKYFNNYFFFLFTIFLSIILISSILSEYKILALKSSLFYFRFCFFALIVWWILEKNNKILKKIYFVLLLCFLALILDSIFQFFYGSNIFNMKLIVKDRVSSFFGDELIMGSYLMRFFPFLVALSFYFYNKEKHAKFIIPSFIFILTTQAIIF